MMKKNIIALALSLCGSIAYAAPSISGSGLTMSPNGKDYYTFDFISGGDSVVSFDQKFDFSSLPADASLGKLTVSDQVIYACSKNLKIVTCAASSTGLTVPITDQVAFLTVEIIAGQTPTTDAGAVVSIDKSYESYQKTETGEDLVPGAVNLKNVVIKSSTPPPAETKYTLTQNSTGTGTFSCTPAGKQAAGTAMTCTAKPGTGFEIGTWGGACAATAKTATVCSFKMPAKNEAASVAFVKKQVTPPTTYTVTTDKNITNGSVTCNPPQGVAGTVAACTAKPNPGFKFERWTNCPGTAAGTTCRITLSDNVMDLSAVFSPIPSQPATPSTATHPVPAVGVWGLLAMLASLAGAASLVLRKKQA